VLDRLGVRTTLWDFRRLGRGDWPSDRFQLIYWIDPFVLPFADPAHWRGGELQGALEEALGLEGLAALPATFVDYLAFVEATLRREGPRLFGLKLALGYQRSLAFAEVQPEAAERAYSGLLRGDRGAYREFQDFMVWWLFHLAGELELPLQIHASFGGPGSHLRLLNNDPAQLQSLLEDPNNRATRVVLLHGAYPYTSHAAVLAWNYPQVWLDFSVLPTLFGASLARWLEEWIELLPRNKLLYGSDASSPEEYYTAAVNGRRQLGVALDNLCRSGTLSLSSAIDIAEHICHRNATQLYNLD
jgi:predicted TIM-barrel fold metal-dependent hydrolase